MTLTAARIAGFAMVGAFGLTHAIPAHAGDDAPKIVLLKKGTGKKIKLRFRPKAGSTQTLKMVSGQEMSMKLGGNAMPSQKLPKTIMTMVIDIKDVDKAGNITAEYSTKSVDIESDPSIPPQVTAQVRESLAPMTSLKGKMKVNARGQVLSADMSASDKLAPELKGMLDNMRENMGQLVVPLPEQAVGVGAEWKVTQNLAKFGMPMTQEATIKLSKMKGDQIELINTMVQKVAAGPVTLPNVPPQVKVRSKPSQSNGTGKLLLDLKEIGATGTIDMNVNVSMVMEAQPGQTQDMDMAVKMSLRMTDGKK